MAGALVEATEIGTKASVAALMPTGEWVGADKYGWTGLESVARHATGPLNKSWLEADALSRSGQDWRAPFFRRGRRQRGPSDPLLQPAPKRSEPSHAMTELPAENDRQREADRQYHEQLGIIRRTN